jgi:hypothetical protein
MPVEIFDAGGRLLATMHNEHGTRLVRVDLAGAEPGWGARREPNIAAEVAAKLALARTSIVPESGSFQGWKLLRDGLLARLEIPEEARRSSGTRRECRAEFVKTIELIGSDVGVSQFGAIYRVDEITRCHRWGDDRWSFDAGGIYFYLSRIEAENY